MRTGVDSMGTQYATPGELVEGLQQRDEGARRRLHDWFSAPLARLLEQLVRRHRLPHAPERLLVHALHLAETFLRTRPDAEAGGLSWNAFRGMLLLQVARVIVQPFGQPGGALRSLPLPESTAYETRGYFQPYERVGEAWFGGDWYGGVRAPDGSLWVLVADVTGHGYHAYLLASALPGLWEQCWRSARPDWQPADCLRAMHHLVESCLPDGIYVECTLARFDPDGGVTVGPAGGSRLVLCRAGSSLPELIKLRGGWLGLLPPAQGDEHRWQLAPGDELLLATDGLFDQLGGLDGSPLELVPRLKTGSSLFDHLQGLLHESLAKSAQRDDITMLLLRRRTAGAASPPPNGTGDVPV
jgi:hypothetical protein